jgi:Ser/Thr protein kinase RdoA (MazF antagonist)
VTLDTAVSESIARLIEDQYDLEITEPPSYVTAAHQRRHRKLVVGTDHGRYLIKTYKRDLVVLDSLRFQHRLSEHLDKNGLPLARILPALNGKRIVEQEDWAIELQEFVPGGPMQMTHKTLATSARALGTFHKVCRDFPCPDRDARKWRFSEVPRDVFGHLYNLAKAEGDDAEMDDACNGIALFLRDAGQELDTHSRNRFETGLIHGDWHGGNLMFDGEELTAVIDLEFAGDGCYLEDLAYALSNLCMRTTTENDRLELRANIILDNYQFSRSLSPWEERALYYAIGVKHIATVSYQSVQMGTGVAGLSASEWMRRLLLQSRWLARRAQKIRWG